MCGCKRAYVCVLAQAFYSSFFTPHKCVYNVEQLKKPITNHETVECTSDIFYYTSGQPQNYKNAHTAFNNNNKNQRTYAYSYDLLFILCSVANIYEYVEKLSEDMCGAYLY